MRIFRKLKAWFYRTLESSHQEEADKIKAKLKVARAELRESAACADTADRTIARLKNESLESDAIIQDLHERIAVLEREKLDLEVKCETLENTKLLNDLAIETLTEMVKSNLELRRTERLTAQAEAFFLNQQVKTNAPHSPQRPDRTYEQPTGMENR